MNHRLAIKTGDELESLAEQFNRSAAALEESYAGLEQKVEDRTAELRESLDQQTATADVLRVISQSPTDVQPVLRAVTTAACRFCGASDALVILRDEADSVVAAHEGSLTASVGRRRPISRDNPTGRAMLDSLTIHVPDSALLDPKEYADALAMAREHNWRAAVAAPMLREGGVACGAIMLRKTEPGAFTPRQIELLETFAAQAVIAIENVRLFTEIQEKSHQLEVASQHKSQFLANMSHELRTPLNAIIGYTEMMADGLYGDVGEKAQGVLERVQSNGRHLLGLINDVLDLSKIEAGQLVLTIEDYSVADMVATVHGGHRIAGPRQEPQTRLRRGARPADWHRRCAPPRPRCCSTWSAMPSSSPTRAGSRSVPPRPATASSCRSSTPAPASRRPIRRESSTSSSRSTTPARARRAAPGSVCRSRARIVELHGGRITVESEVGKGSTFTVSIPVNAAVGQGCCPMSKKILVVEDTEDNRQILRDLLGMAGYDMIEAHDGAEGVAMASEHKPDLILMDIQMPVMDGYEATRRIKADPALKSIPMIAVTSYALSGDEDKARAAGCDGYVAKPFSPRQMLAKVREILG